MEMIKKIFDGPSNFKNTFSLEKRIAQHSKALQNRADLIGVIVEKLPASKLTFSRPFFMFGFSYHSTLSEVRENVRKQLKMSQNHCLFLFCNGVLPRSNQLLGNLKRFAEEDGFIYLFVAEQDTLGGKYN